MYTYAYKIYFYIKPNIPDQLNYIYIMNVLVLSRYFFINIIFRLSPAASLLYFQFGINFQSVFGIHAFKSNANLLNVNSFFFFQFPTHNILSKSNKKKQTNEKDIYTNRVRDNRVNKMK